MNPSYEHRLTLSTQSKWMIVGAASALIGAIGYVAFRRAQLDRSRREELLEAYANRVIPTAELPPDFSFVGPETTLQMVAERAGPYTRSRRVPATAARYGAPDSPREATSLPLTVFEYELPGGSAIVVMPEPPFEPNSRIRAVVYRRSHGTYN